MFIGDGARQPRILREGEEVLARDAHLVDAIPVEFKQAFLDDITKALRDVGGHSTMAIHPYMPRRDDVVVNFGQRKNLFAKDAIDFAVEKARIRMGLVKQGCLFPRWAHIDLGLTSDSAGLVIGHVPGFREIERDGYTEQLPIVEIDGVLEVIPPKALSGEIDFAAIRRILYRLRDMGMPIKWVTLDSFQSADTMQILRQQGFVVGYQSVDTTMVPYDITKQALYDHRVVAPPHAKLMKELCSLERDFKRGKVDHPSHGSKDCADALAGVVFGLTMRRDVWVQHSVPVTQAVSVASVMRDNDHEKSDDRRAA